MGWYYLFCVTVELRENILDFAPSSHTSNLSDRNNELWVICHLYNTNILIIIIMQFKKCFWGLKTWLLPLDYPNMKEQLLFIRKVSGILRHAHNQYCGCDIFCLVLIFVVFTVINTHKHKFIQVLTSVSDGLTCIFGEFPLVILFNRMKIFRLICNPNVYTHKLVWSRLTAKISTNES